MTRITTHPRLLWRLALSAVTTALLLSAYRRVLRPWQQHWGATAAEVAASMSGDQLVHQPFEVTTRAVTVDAPAAAIWPWLVQMGNNRGGLYSYDWLDLRFGALDRPSVDRVLPEFQNLREGDLLPYAKGSEMRVAHLDRCRALLLVYTGTDAEVTQSWRLYPLDERRTRLVLRVRGGLPPGAPAGLKGRLGQAFVEATEFPMVRQQLLGIKRRAERLAATHCMERPTVRTAGKAGQVVDA
jgi:hypothetical protein